MSCHFGVFGNLSDLNRYVNFFFVEILKCFCKDCMIDFMGYY